MIEIRPATSSETPAALTVHSRAFAHHDQVYRPRPDDAAQQAERLNEGIRIIALDNGTIIGTAQYANHASHVHVLGLAVDPRSQRRGLARCMLDWIERKAVELGQTTVAVDTIAETGNVAIFERLGFTVVHTTRSTKFQSDAHGTLHLVQMEKPCQQSPSSHHP